MTDSPSQDELDDALDTMVVALRESTKCNQRAIRQAQTIRRRCAAGQPYGEVFARQERSEIRQLTRDNIDQMIQAGARFRWAEARTLHAEGLTMDKIAALFGLTRQRISSLLRENPELRVEGRRRKRSPSGPSLAAFVVRTDGEIGGRTRG